MTKSSALAELLESFFYIYLGQQRRVSPATLASYRDGLRLLVLFAAQRDGRLPSDLGIADLDREVILAFLDHLEKSRGNSVATRNARLAAIRSFFHHVSYQDPAALGVARRVLEIPVKRGLRKSVKYLDAAELQALLAAPDPSTVQGRRDRVLLLFLARTGARVSEALGVNVGDIDLKSRPHVLLRGKCQKERMLPLAADLARELRCMFQERGIGSDLAMPLFTGRRGERLTRFGATHVLRRASAQARLNGRRVSPHVLRHTLAMQLLQSGADLISIQAWLGHASVATTHTYAEADLAMMRKCLSRVHMGGKGFRRFRPSDAVLRVLQGH